MMEAVEFIASVEYPDPALRYFALVLRPGRSGPSATLDTLDLITKASPFPPTPNLTAAAHHPSNSSSMYTKWDLPDAERKGQAWWKSHMSSTTRSIPPSLLGSSAFSTYNWRTPTPSTATASTIRALYLLSFVNRSRRRQSLQSMWVLDDAVPIAQHGVFCKGSPLKQAFEPACSVMNRQHTAAALQVPRIIPAGTHLLQSAVECWTDGRVSFQAVVNNLIAFRLSVTETRIPDSGSKQRLDERDGEMPPPPKGMSPKA
ncbi:unnamed protein product [Diplocarpon coronariae]